MAVRFRPGVSRWRGSAVAAALPAVAGCSSAPADVPITCVNWTSRFSDTQLKFECGGYTSGTGGTSGSPRVTTPS